MVVKYSSELNFTGPCVRDANSIYGPDKVYLTPPKLPSTTAIKVTGRFQFGVQQELKLKWPTRLTPEDIS